MADIWCLGQYPIPHIIPTFVRYILIHRPAVFDTAAENAANCQIVYIRREKES